MLLQLERNHPFSHSQLAVLPVRIIILSQQPAGLLPSTIAINYWQSGYAGALSATADVRNTMLFTGDYEYPLISASTMIMIEFNRIDYAPD